MTNITIGQRVMALRVKAGLNQGQIAKFLGVNQSTISKCEKGKRSFQVDHIERLGSLFGVSLGDLLNEEVSVESLRIAFSAGGMREEDLNAISEVQKIVLNLDQMHAFLQEQGE